MRLELNLFPKICISVSNLKIKSTKYEFSTLKKNLYPQTYCLIGVYFSNLLQYSSIKPQTLNPTLSFDLRNLVKIHNSYPITHRFPINIKNKKHRKLLDQILICLDLKKI